MNEYTINQWRKDGEFKAQRFQEIDRIIYYRFLESVPPMKQSRNAFISGGAYSYDYENGKNLYMAFYRNGEIYYYLGLIHNDDNELAEAINSLIKAL